MNKYNIEIQDLQSNSWHLICGVRWFTLFYYLWLYDNNKAKRVIVTKQLKRRKHGKR